MDIRSVIANKRDGRELTGEEISLAVAGYVGGEASEAQMAALLMAIVLRGMSPRETADLTFAMVESGERLDLGALPTATVDKHSTGGVGDKTTLVVAPLAASLGVAVPKMSGRALGHTGGTIDKLESISGLTTDLPPDRFCRQIADIGVAIAVQTERMAPADKRIYSLRDATATVESVALIASSVMSKKLAVGADAIVLDVKAGRGAFMRDEETARELAKAMVEIGGRAGKRVVALVTRMDQPLGRAVGDAAEVAEAVETLSGGGPADFRELCEIVAGHMLAAGGAASGPEEGCSLARRGLADGSGMAKFREMVAAQGGQVGTLDEPGALASQCDRIPVELERRGCVTGIDARRVGMAVRELKLRAGVHKAACGVILHRKVGESADREPVASIFWPAAAGATPGSAIAEVRAAFEVGRDAPAAQSVLADVVTA